MPQKLEDMQKAIKKALKKNFPDLKDDELESRAWKIAQDRWKKMQKEENMKPEIKEKAEDMPKKKRILVAEHVPIIINADMKFFVKEE